MGKGSKKRPRLISRARYDLNWALALGEITFKQWKKKKAKLDREENAANREDNKRA